MLPRLALVAFFCFIPCTIASEPIVVYYYAQWAVWVREFCASEFEVDGQFKGVTHVQYAFHFPDSNCDIVTLDVDADFGGDGWQLNCELKCPNPLPDGETKDIPSVNRGSVGCLKKIARERGFKLGISLGGWTKSADFSQCAADSDKRARMINSITEQAELIGWDFIDFDWEYPYGGGNDGFIGLQNDWDNFKVLIDELKVALDQKGLQAVGIAGAFGMNPDLIEGNDPYTLPTPMRWLCENLDYVSLMSYDLMGGWTPQTGWPAPLEHDPAAPYKDADKLNIRWQLETWKAACGQDLFQKVILGLPAYAKAWRSVPPGDDGTGVYENCTYTGTGPTGFPDMPCLGDGSFIETAGTLELWDIETLYKPDSRCAHYFHDVAKQAFVYCPDVAMYAEDNAEDVWFAWDEPETFWWKTKLAKDMGAGGFMFWEPAYTALGDNTNYSYMTPTKSAALQEIRGGLPTEYFWGPYEDAAFDGWNGNPLGPHVSVGQHVGGDGSGSVPICDEVSSGSVSDGSVDSACMASFCSLACHTFMDGGCASSPDPNDCVQQQITAIPPAGQSGIACQYTTSVE